MFDSSADSAFCLRTHNSVYIQIPCGARHWIQHTNVTSSPRAARRHTLFDVSARLSWPERASLIPEPSQSAELRATCCRGTDSAHRISNPGHASLVDDTLTAKYAKLRPQISQDYHDLQKRSTLPPRPPHDHLLDDTTLPYGSIYSLSKVEHLALQEFLDENLNNQFIRPSQSSIAPPVLFIKKKHGSLRLTVDDRGLNKITKKDRYSPPLIPDLLDHLRSPRVFSKARSWRHLQSRAHSRRQ